MLTSLRYLYRVTKPRVQSQNSKNLHTYRKQLHQARVRLHKQSVQYLNKLQDQFLQKHKKKMAERHYGNQCAFRSKIARNSYLLFESMEKQKSKHAQNLQRIQKFIRQQQVKKLNRERIKKILQYESSNFWLEGDKLSQKIIAQKVLPDYIGSTEYYHKLHSQALAYDELDFEMLHKMSSNQESVQYKNKLLIPIYKQILVLMRQVKFSDEERTKKQFEQAKTKLMNLYNKDSTKLNAQIKVIQQNYDKKIEQINQRKSNTETKQAYLKQKLKDLILLLKKWKEYTDILGMTSSEVHKLIADTTSQQSIVIRKKALQKQIIKKRQTTFVDPIQQDTEDEEVSLANYLTKNEEPNSALKPKSDAVTSLNDELATLLKDHQSLFNEISQQIKQQQLKLNKQSQNLPNLSKEALQDLTLNQDLQIQEGFLQSEETTTTIEIMKQKFKEDQSMKNLLNIAGELSVQYPKLFKKVWDTQIL